MPIYDQGYRAYEGKVRSRLFRWWPIAWRCFRSSMRWPFTVVSVLGLLPLFWSLLQAYAIGIASDETQLTRIEAGIVRIIQRTPMGESFEYGDGLFFGLLSNEVLWAVLLLWFVGAGQIAEDFRTGALQVYFAKPITQLDYILGKMCTVMLGAFWLTLLPGTVLLLGVVAFAPDWTILTENPWLPLKILGFATVVGTVFGSLVLAISSFARSGRMAGLTFFGLYIFTAVLGHVLPEIFNDPAWKAVYLKGCVDAIGHDIFPGSPLPEISPTTAWIVLGGIVLASLLVFVRKVEAVEVVS
jgi:ABC-2 type transport system permease protein